MIISTATSQHGHRKSNLTKGCTHELPIDTNLLWKQAANEESRIKAYREMHGGEVVKAQLMELVSRHRNPTVMNQALASYLILTHIALGNRFQGTTHKYVMCSKLNQSIATNEQQSFHLITNFFKTGRY